MKYLAIILLLFIGCKNSTDIKIPFVEPVYHIKAEHFYECKWQVIFTNNNFLTEDNIMQAFDLSGEYTGNEICHIREIFDSEEEAILFAKKFHNYESCKKFNDSVSTVADSLRAYRNRNPIEKIKNIQESECNNQKGKEIIVY